MRNQALPADTTLEAMRVQIACWQKLGQEGRSWLAARLSDQARQISREGIRRLHPEYTESQTKLALARHILGEDLFAKAFPIANAD